METVSTITLYAYTKRVVSCLETERPGKESLTMTRQSLAVKVSFIPAIGYVILYWAVDDKDNAICNIKYVYM